MLHDHQRLQLVDVVHPVVLVVVRRGDHGLLEGLAGMAHVKVHFPRVGALGKDVGTVDEEGVVAAQLGVELLVGGVGRGGGEEVNGAVRVIGLSRGVVDGQCTGIPLLITPTQQEEQICIYKYVCIQLREKGAVQVYVHNTIISIHIIIHIPNVYTRIRVYIHVLSCDNAVSPLIKCNIIVHLAPGLCKVSGHI